jgi:tRNA(fMet)-specific endonuclease VapC
MLAYLLDTDHLTLYDYAHPLVLHRIAQPRQIVGISDITVEESLRGRLAALAQARAGPTWIVRYGLLRRTVHLFQRFPTVPFDQASEDRSQQLLTLSLRVGTQDLKITAVALANQAVLLTRNRRDFGRIPGLVVDDWSI